MKTSKQKKCSATNLLPLLLLLAAVAATAGCDRSGSEDVVPSTAEKSSDNTPSEEVSEGGAADDAASQATDSEGRSPTDYDMEAEREARIAVSRDAFGDEGPINCTTVCDCPPGFGCQGGSNRCIPAMISGRCCSWETDCPSGQTCTDENGDSGTCAE